ncbi:hypothetical protein ES288_A11G100900v1 [Gossypium darwinii]|uniref:Uncharacterized protein n=1 Tax=Gossypium darwinii TaxID=34276 RepID=A0A5D2EJD6_GOSDA|nr:hypothetical protein ES288_A11G100900v1 [Gossypium darwinii]
MDVYTKGDSMDRVSKLPSSIYWQVGSGLEIVGGKITLSNYHFWEN